MRFYDAHLSLVNTLIENITSRQELLTKKLL